MCLLCESSNSWTLIRFFSLVFSQSLISLDLIEDFLELASREKTEDKDKPLIYKGKLQTFLYYNFWNLRLNILYKHFNNKILSRHTTLIYTFFCILLVLIYINMAFIVAIVTWHKIFFVFVKNFIEIEFTYPVINHFKWTV